MKALLILVVLLAGCATQRSPMTREEWLSITTREYEAVKKDEALAAAEKLLRLADGNDFQIVHTDEGLHATRNWSVYLVLAAATGIDHWRVLASPTDQGTRVAVQVNTQSQAISPMATTGGDWTATTGPMSGSPVNGTAIYDVFWARMDYLLGKSPEWMDCKTANLRVKQKLAWGSNEALCNSFNVADKSPVEVQQPEPKGPSIGPNP